MSEVIQSALARILDAHGNVVGTGFLVPGNCLLTCAHVVEQALSVPSVATDMPEGSVRLDFPLVSPGAMFAAQVVRWRPVCPEAMAVSHAPEDIAVLQIAGDPPPGACPLTLATADNLWGHRIRTFGFPDGQDDGVWAQGMALAPQGRGWIQIEGEARTGYFVSRGFSGAPIWDEQTGGVIGMVVAADKQADVKAAFLIPTCMLAQVWPECVVSASSDAIRARQTGSLTASLNPPGNAPLPTRHFLGRVIDIQSIIAEFSAGGTHRIAVVGTGGLGKTELAKSVAQRCLGEGVVEYVLWASASPYETSYHLHDLDSLLEMALRVLELPIARQMDIREQEVRLRQFLVSHPALLILDNWETVEEPCRRSLWNFVVSLPASCRVLLTSRHALSPRDVRNIDLDLLPAEEAEQLFSTIMDNVGLVSHDHSNQQETAERVRHICERVGGHPLAIEVLAAQTVSRTLKSIWESLRTVPKEVLQEVDELTGETRGMWTSLDLSYDVLSDNAKKLFRQIGVLLVPATADEVVALTTCRNTRVELDMLVRRSLVRMQEGRYSLLPVVKDYAQSKFSTSGKQIRDIHYKAYSHYRKQKTLDSMVVAAEYAFYLAAAKAPEIDDFQAHWLLATLEKPLIKSGRWSELKRLIERSLSLAEARENRIMQAIAHVDLGQYYCLIGKYETAERYCRQGLAIGREINHRISMAGALHCLGMIYERRKNYDEALQMLEESIALARQNGDEHGIAMGSFHVGNIEYLRNNFDVAENIYARCLKILEKIKDEEGQSIIFHQLGMVAHGRKDYQKAQEMLERSLAMNEAQQDLQSTASNLYELSRLAASQDQVEQAIELCDRSLEIVKRLGDGYGIALCSDFLGGLKIRQQKYSEAATLYRQSLPYREDIGNESATARHLYELAVVQIAEKDYENAELVLEQCHAIVLRTGDHVQLSGTLILMGKVANVRNNGKQALGHLLRGIALLSPEEQSDRTHAGLAWELIAEVMQRAGEEQTALWIGELVEADAALELAMQTWPCFASVLIDVPAEQLETS